ncbi:MAG: lipoyl(octanoyl) transferase LipB [Desulfobacterota bacterium]|jgi:lipoate-protein ligase B|nr:lipoyl(octanoyl) transferase LipB [Thermodesulfobacteriota bacterium]
MRANQLQNTPYENAPLLTRNRVEVRRLGAVAYGAAYPLQKKLQQQRVEGEIGDTLLLLEHPPTITVGKAGNIENILISREALHRKGISLYFVDRGGDVTYHGPGQLVGYTIFDLSSRGGDLKRYVRDLEEVLIRTLDDFSIRAGRDPQHVGVWIGHKKIAAIGLSIHKWVTMHGFALNVSPVLEHFSLIHGCGLKDREATSMEDVLGTPPSMEQVTERLLEHFSKIFHPEP